MTKLFLFISLFILFGCSKENDIKSTKTTQYGIIHLPDTNIINVKFIIENPFMDEVNVIYTILRFDKKENQFDTIEQDIYKTITEQIIEEDSLEIGFRTRIYAYSENKISINAYVNDKIYSSLQGNIVISTVTN